MADDTDDLHGQRQTAWRAMVEGLPRTADLDHADAQVRWFAAESLAERTEDRDVEKLHSLLFHNDEYVSQAAADGLCESGDRGLELLLEAIDRGPSELAFWTVQAWAAAEGTDALDKLMHYLRHGTLRQQQAVQSLLARLVHRASAHLLALLADESLRLTALVALLQQGESARPVLEQSATPLAQAALAALGQLNPPGGQSPRAVTLAQVLAPADAVPLLVHLIQSSDSKTSYFAARQLADRGEASLPSLFDLLAHPRTDVRRRAVEIIRDKPTPVAIPALRQALTDEDVKVRQNAVRALAHLGEEEALAALSGDPALAVRRALRQALGSTS